MLDLHPSVGALVELLGSIGDDQLALPTPCPEMTLEAMLQHVEGFAMAFTAAAEKRTPDLAAAAGTTGASGLGGDWRDRIPEALERLARAWGDPEAWQGQTTAAGIELGAVEAGLFALDEAVVHGWDVAVAIGADLRPDPAVLPELHAFLAASAEANPEGTPGLFGPPVSVPSDAPLLDRIVALAGRDPAWVPGSMG